MAYPVDFPGTNTTMLPPANRDDVEPVRAFVNSGVCVTCWELTPEEIQEIMATGRVYLSMLFGGKMVPAFVAGEQNTRALCCDYGKPLPKSVEA